MRRLRRLWLPLTSVALLLSAVIGVDVYPPATVAWQPEVVSGIRTWRAAGLVLQGRHGRDVYATRGYTIYRSRDDGPFRRFTTVLPRLGLDWGGFSATLRRLTRHQELTEVVPLNDRELVVFAGGDIYRVDARTGAQQWVHRLRYFGLREGRGVMPDGIAEDDLGYLYYGEYPTGPGGRVESIRLYRSTDGGSTWQVAYEFPAGTVRHIHAVEWDPYGKALWVATGDHDDESRIGYSTDRGKTFTWIGSGSQVYRAVSLVFGPRYVKWVMDSPLITPHLVRWDRRTHITMRSGRALPSPGYYSYSLSPNTSIFTLAEREASVWVTRNGYTRKLLGWNATFNSARPNPCVRLVRSFSTPSPDWIWLNPLSTDSESAAIYRIPSRAATETIELAQAREH